ncbi:MAG: CRISPR-associated protein Cas5 [Candidatus Micrarchaeota archaeon]|nr:CRISPR-associated protein Cas5 [Candidatus Micrarchaeota archaeon]
MTEDISNYWFYYLELEGWLAHFRQPTTLTTKLSYLLPPKSTAIGFLLAKVGYFKNVNYPSDIYMDLVNKIKIAISMDVKRINKFIDYVLYYPSEFDKLKPTNLEYIVRPKYKLIYFIPKDDKYLGEANSLVKDRLLNKEFFKIYLGSNECPATVLKSKEVRVISKGNVDSIFTDFAVPIKEVVLLPNSDVIHASILTSVFNEKSGSQLKEEEVFLPLKKCKFDLKEKKTIYSIENSDLDFMVI